MGKHFYSLFAERENATRSAADAPPQLVVYLWVVDVVWHENFAGLAFYYIHMYIYMYKKRARAEPQANNAAQRFGLNEVMCVDHDHD